MMEANRCQDRHWSRSTGLPRHLQPDSFICQDSKVRDRALFDLVIDSKLRGCDWVRIKISDLVAGGRVRNCAMVIQQKTKRLVQFELLEPACFNILAWLERRGAATISTSSRSQAASIDQII